MGVRLLARRSTLSRICVAKPDTEWTAVQGHGRNGKLQPKSFLSTVMNITRSTRQRRAI